MKKWKELFGAALVALLIGAGIGAPGEIFATESEPACNHTCAICNGGYTQSATSGALSWSCGHVHDETCGYNAGGYSYNDETNTYEVDTAGAMQAAIDAAEESGTTNNPATIKLMANLDLPGVATEPTRPELKKYGVLIDAGVMSIDLNGFTLSNSNATATIQIGTGSNVSCSAVVTIMDSSAQGTGVVISVGTDELAHRAIQNDCGTLFINSGTIKAEGTAAVNGVRNTNGKVTVNGGKIYASTTSTAYKASGIYSQGTNNLSLTVNGGEISDNGTGGYGINAVHGVITIKDGTIAGGEYALSIAGGVEASITGGSFTDSIWAHNTVTGFLSIDENGKGATFPNGITVESIESNESNTLNAILATGAGFYDTSGNFLTVDDNATSITETVTVGCAGHTGGTANCVSGKTCEICGRVYGDVDANNHGEMDETTGKCSNGCGNFLAVASVTTGEGTTYYAELQTAIDAAELSNGCTLTLENDITVEGGFTIDAGSFTLELNGKTLNVSENALHALQVKWCSLVIQDSTGENQGSIAGKNVLNISNSTVELKSGELNSGVFVFNGIFIQSGGTVKGILDLSGENYTISGGTIDEIDWQTGTIDVRQLTTISNVRIMAKGVPMSEPYETILLPEGYALYVGAGLLGKDDSVESDSQVQIGACEHSGENVYSASGNVIKETCEICETTFGTVTVTAENPTFDGTAKEVTVTKTGTLANADLTVAYYEGGILLGAAPVNAGTYTAKISYNEKTASIDYTIAKATPYIVTNPTATGTYGNSLSEIEISGAASFNGTAVDGYFLWEAENADGIVPEAGTYTEFTAKFCVTNTMYAEVTGIPVTLVINKAANAPDMPAATRNVAYETELVESVSLPKGWAWKAEDASLALPVGVAVKATALYTGADKGNYETETVVVTITRSTCNHSYTSGVTKQPTVDAEGVRTYTCSVCGYSYTEVIEKLEPTPIPTPGGSSGGGYYPPYTPSYPTPTPSPTAIPTPMPTVTPTPTTPMATGAPTVAPAYHPENTWVTSEAYKVFSEAEKQYDVLLGTSAKTAAMVETMEVGDTIDLNFYGVKNWKKNSYTYKWTSSDESVAVVDKAGVVTMLDEGVVIINLELVYKATGEKLSVAPILVGAPEAVYNVFVGTSVKETSLLRELALDKTVDLNFYGVKNWKKDDYEYEWISSNAEVATVNKMGVVTTKAPGMTVIRLKLKHKATGEYLVVAPVVLTVPERVEE